MFFSLYFLKLFNVKENFFMKISKTHARGKHSARDRGCLSTGYFEFYDDPSPPKGQRSPAASA